MSRNKTHIPNSRSVVRITITRCWEDDLQFYSMADHYRCEGCGNVMTWVEMLRQEMYSGHQHCCDVPDYWGTRYAYVNRAHYGRN